MTVRKAAKGSYSRYNQKYNIGFINSDPEQVNSCTGGPERESGLPVPKK